MPSAPRRADVLDLAYALGDETFRLAGESLGPRTLDDHEIVLVLHGEIDYRADGVAHAAPAGTLLLTRPGFVEQYRWIGRARTRFAYAHLGIRAVPRDWPAPATWPIATRLAPDDLVRPAFRALLAHWCCAGGRGEPPRSIQRVVEVLLAAVLVGPRAADAPRSGPPAGPVARVVAALGEAFADGPPPALPLQRLARIGGVTPQHLCRLFRRELGLSPMEAVRLMRLDHALLRLASSDASIEAVSAACGFASPYHFSRLFHAVYGLPPSRLRARLEAHEPLPVGPLPRALHRRGL